jgi:hypothetical protein
MNRTIELKTIYYGATYVPVTVSKVREVSPGRLEAYQSVRTPLEQLQDEWADRIEAHRIRVQEAAGVVA